MTSVIKVDNIQNSSGTSALSINSGGYALLNTPAWNQVGIPNAPTANSVIIWNSGNTGSFAKHGCSYNSSTGVVTVPVAGLYMVHFNIICREQTAGNTIAIQIEKSTDGGSTFSGATSADYATLEEAEVGARWRTLNKTIILDLNANDEIRIRNDNSETWEVPTNDNTAGNFSGYLIGAS